PRRRAHAHRSRHAQRTVRLDQDLARDARCCAREGQLQRRARPARTANGEAMRTLLAGIAAFAVAGALPAIAHHSAALIYDLEKQVTIEGVVTRFELGNPHVRIYFTPKDKQAEWMAEGGSRTVLLRHGWTDDRLKSGDHIVILGNPSRDG